MINLQYFYSTIKDGNMNQNKKYYPQEMTKEEIKEDFRQRRIKLGQKMGYDGLKVLTPIQKKRPDLTGKSVEEQEKMLQAYESKYQDGYHVRITKDMIMGYEDLYDLDIYADILVMDQGIQNVALAYPVADCPVIFVEDSKSKTVSFAHCGGEYIDRSLPYQMIDAIREETDAKTEDIKVVIGPHIHKESYTYNGFPGYIKNPNNWSGALEEIRGYIHIDMEKAIRTQLEKQKIKDENIFVSSIDTATSPFLYSNNQAQSNKEKMGLFYTGCFYKEAPSNIKILKK